MSDLGIQPPRPEGAAEMEIPKRTALRTIVPSILVFIVFLLFLGVFGWFLAQGLNVSPTLWGARLPRTPSAVQSQESYSSTLGALPFTSNPLDPQSPTWVGAISPSVSVVLGRPTAASIVLNVLSTGDKSIVVDYGTATATVGLNDRTALAQLLAGRPQEIMLSSLSGNSRYLYRLVDANTNETLAEGTFHTQRAPGSTFTFEIQGDSHPERSEHFNSALYTQVLRSAAMDRPDFYFTSGDDFSVDRLKSVNATTVAERYLLQRSYLAQVAQFAPVYLVNGNHERGASSQLNGTPNSVGVWAQTSRNSLFPQPAPDDFYSGDVAQVPYIGQLRDYYAWVWGDALFVVIDPYWHSTRKDVAEGWDVTLGNAQYAWLETTLKTSSAKYKFVFAHHVLGTGRGGIEQAGLFEWGGENLAGSNEFSRMRPSWGLPIHDLMAKNGVTVFFQGHDHVFAKQQLDGVVYQTLPNPSEPEYTSGRAKYYHSGVLMPNSGRVRVTVSPEKTLVEYVRSYLPKDAATKRPDGGIAYSYEIPAR